MTDIARLFTELTDLSTRLNQESDALTDLITRFETALCDLKLGVEVSLEKPIRSVTVVDEKNLVEVTTVTLMGFHKGEQGWALYVWYAQNDEAIRDSERRLRDAAREDRIAAPEHFPALLKAMKKKAEEVVSEIQRVTKTAKLAL